MTQNVYSDERLPRIGLAVAAGVAAVFAPTRLRTGLLGLAAGLVASVATGYCPLKAALSGRRALNRGDAETAWRTLKTSRVQA
jgi:hypothetical protein